MTSHRFRLIQVALLILISLGASAQDKLNSIKVNIENALGAYKTSVDDFKEQNDNSLVGFNYAYTDLLKTLEQSLEQDGLLKEYAAALVIINSHYLKQVIALDDSQSQRIKGIFITSLNSISPASPHWKLEASGEAPLTRMASGLLSENEAQNLYSSALL